MALDGIVTRAIVHELQQCVGSRISKIHQPSEHDIIFHFRIQGTNRKLLLSANPTYPRLHFTEQTFINPLEAPMFCMLMRKHCENGIIESIHQIGMERIIHIQIRSRDELGDLGMKTIVIEIMGRHSNLILLDPERGIILDSIHHVTPAISSYRVVLPGSAYIPPPDQDKQNPLEMDKANFIACLSASMTEQTEQSAAWNQQLVSRLSGISPLSAKEIVHRAGIETSRQPAVAGSSPATHDVERLADALGSAFSEIRANRYNPVHAEAGSGRVYFSAIELTHLRGRTIHYPTISLCLEAYFADKAERDLVKQRTADLSRFLHNELNKNVKKMDKLHHTLETSKEADRYRILGELLTASLHAVQRGDTFVEAVNYYDETQAVVRIELDPQLTPSDNAQRYFKRYTKAKNSAVAVQEQIAATEDEMNYLRSLIQQLNNASLVDIDEIREELVEQGYIRDRTKRLRKKKKNNRPALLCYTSSEGAAIYVGKNNTQNDFLTSRLAHPNDTWLHTKDIPGSHVVIRGSAFGDATLEEAAQLAAYYSQAQHSSQVPVDYTLIRHVRKPNGAKPGFVIYEQQKTLYVTPDAERIQQWRSEIK